MKQKGRGQEEIVEQVKKLLEERGRRALEMARKEISKEKIAKQDMETILKMTKKDQNCHKLFCRLVKDALFQASQLRQNTEILQKLILSTSLLA